ncbi:carbohydrate sulfotransferase 11-like [Diadema antillarum]
MSMNTERTEHRKPSVEGVSDTQEDHHSSGSLKEVTDEKETPDDQHIATLKERISWLREQCALTAKYRKSRDVAVYPPESLIVNEKHKILYCNVPKVGCTSWKAVFLKMAGYDKFNISAMDHLGTNRKGRIYLDYLHKYTNISHRRYILKNYVKFMFVRHPYTRLLSAFRSKLAPNVSYSFRYRNRAKGAHAPWISTYGKTIITKYRGAEEGARVSSDWRKEYDLTFAEFIRFVIDPDTDSYNKHWSDMSSMCLPCDIEYDVIGKYETISADAPYVLQLANVAPNISFPTPAPGSVTSSSSPGTAERIFRSVPRDHLLKLATLYSEDFRLFHYDPSSYEHD